MANKQLAQKLLYAVPLCMAIGISLREYQNSIVEEEEVIRKRVLQALGEWTPPKLSAAERSALETERAIVRTEIAELSKKIEAKKRKEADMFVKRDLR